MALRVLFIVHAVVTFAAGVVLVVAPALIPLAVGIAIEPSQYLVCYLLGAVEIAVAVLSFFATRLVDAAAIRLVSLTFIVVHLVTAVVEVLAIAQGASPLLWGNVALRIVVAALFGWFGVARVGLDRLDRR
jgi:hypothetical protein